MSAPDFSLLDVIRSRRPLIHCISNLVSANDCANLALALGASPIMAQARQEMEAIAAASDAAVLNTGTPDEEKFRSPSGPRRRGTGPAGDSGPCGHRGKSVASGMD